MILSPMGRRLLQNREGCRLSAYQDTMDVWTIGYGWTGLVNGAPIQGGLTMTQEQAETLFDQGIRRYEDAVSSGVTVPMADHEFDALVSFCYNVGIGGFRSSTALKRLNMGQRREAADALLMWDKPPEILGRRRAERMQFLHPYA